MPVTSLRAAFFDAGGTLFTERSSRAAIYASVAARHGLQVSNEAMATAMKETFAALPREIEGAYRYSRPWFTTFIEVVLARVGFAGDPTPIARDLFAASTTPARTPCSTTCGRR